MWKKAVWNLITTAFFLVISTICHFCVRPVPPESWGILLVGIGAVRLALVSARSHMRTFDDTSQNPDAEKERRTEDYRPHVAGNMVDAFSGFALVAIGFAIRVGSEFLY